MADFGSRPTKAQGRIDLTLRAGEAVDIVGGRLRGSHGVLEDWEDLPTPAGATVRVVRIRRPRAGVSWEFPDMVQRREQP